MVFLDVWRRYVYSILRFFMQLMGKTYRLDFTADPEISDRHQILDLAEMQRERDRVRLTKIRGQLSRVDPEMLAAHDADALREVLNTLDELLPQIKTTSS